MARYFLDSSALVKRYHQERGSAELDNLFQRSEHRFFVARLALVEANSTFARLVREGVLSESDLGQVIARLEADVAANVFAVLAVSGPRLEAASAILRTHGLSQNIRTLDAIHLAVAQALDRRRRLAAFVAADKRLLASAAACGLSVLDLG